MAIVNSIILGRAKGSIGNVSFSTQKGRVIARQKPTIVANPNTALQRNQRAKVSVSNVAWYFIGNFVKSGITQLVGYGSAFNTYVSKNADLFVNKALTKENFTFKELRNTFATVGALPIISTTLDDESASSLDVSFSKSELSMFANVGDLVKVVAGKENSDSVSYSEVVLTEEILNALSPSVTFEGLSLVGSGSTVGAVWFESADGRISSTSKFGNL